MKASRQERIGRAIHFAWRLWFYVEWSVPAAVFLIMHLKYGWPIGLFFVGVALMVTVTILLPRLFGRLRAAGQGKTPERPNQNPYSAGREGSDTVASDGFPNNGKIDY